MVGWKLLWGHKGPEWQSERIFDSIRIFKLKYATPLFDLNQIQIRIVESNRFDVLSGNNSQGAETDSSTQSKKHKLKSKVWDHFERVANGDTVKAICNYCKTVLSATHADKCFVKHGGVTWQRQSQLNFTGHSRGVCIFSQDESRDKLTQMFINHKYPFSMAKHDGFIDFMQTVQPQFTIPGRMTLQNNSVNLYGKYSLQAERCYATLHYLTTNLLADSKPHYANLLASNNLS
ncbi:uncharacterized protein PGTG_20552 [Puccinia graminis f. sp. tritici CRL 75-36-700-3]|uniref:BED-type domain-containing protein n=1 Tax=Puccinia graminis f. sp. tritici (strain CRL 75-36-700-3 / race SCCL) TaxID=418459 RepID=E3NYE7_PUCGT|nr:uncharacterized protein PGTG_20552 [Puccinia graminis f. sp. tritici CRL 75-36-700-3]EFP94596.1 hypothetical protein PGTG_20552 [Puccinia graminis f. sp. tritici CRL 75-36-700-3]